MESARIKIVVLVGLMVVGALVSLLAYPSVHGGKSSDSMNLVPSSRKPVVLNEEQNSLVLAPTIKDGDKSRTGTRYITYNRALGQFNNQLMSLEMAVCLARMSNRTVAFAGFIEKYHIRNKIEGLPPPLSKYLDVKRAISKKVPLVDWEKFIQDVGSKASLNTHSFFHYPKKFTVGSPLYSQAMEEVRKSLLSDVALVDLPHIFHWRLHEKKRCRESEARYFYSNVVVKKDYRKVADKFIRENLPQPYAAIHYRRLDGRCNQTIQEIVKRISRHIRKQKISSIFLASDRSDPEGDKILQRKFQTKVFNGKLTEVYAPGIVDMYIVSKANILYTNPWSTLATNAISYNKYYHKINSTVVRYTKMENGKVVC